MDIRRSPLSFDGYTATIPTDVTLSDTLYYIKISVRFVAYKWFNNLC